MKTQNNKVKKLTLNKRTIVLLNEQNMGMVNGGTGMTDDDNLGGLPSGLPGKECIVATKKQNIIADKIDNLTDTKVCKP